MNAKGALIQTISNTKVVDIVGTMLFCCCYYGLFLQHLGGNIQLIMRGLSVVSAMILVIVEIQQGMVNRTVITTGLILTIFIVTDVLFVEAKSLPALGQMYIAFTMGLYIARGTLLPTGTRIMFWSTIIVLAALYYLNGERVFPDQGRNFCGAYALLVFFFLAVSMETLPRTGELLLSAAACLALSIFTTGRGSIISCAFLFACLLFLNLYRKKDSSKLVLGISISILILIVGITVTEAVGLDLLSRFGSISAERSNDARSQLYQDYLTTALASPNNILLGVNPMTIVNDVIIKTEGNLHNSLFQWHANFGLIGLLILIWVLSSGIISLWSQGDTIVAAAAAAIVLRSLTDTMFVATVWDSLIFYLIFSMYRLPSSLQKGDSLNLNNRRTLA